MLSFVLWMVNYNGNSLSIFYDLGLDAIILGAFMFIGFLIIGLSTQKSGSIPTTTAFMVSFSIAAIYSWIALAEPVKASKILAVIMAFMAMPLILEFNPKDLQNVIYPFLVFVTNGMVQILFLTFKRNLSETNFLYFCGMVFLFAGVSGSLFTLSRQLPLYSFKEIIWGIVMGITNFFSVSTLFLALFSWKNYSIFFGFLYSGILLIITLVGIFFYRDRIIPRKFLGLILALLSIIIFYLLEM